jgi:predicted regulator of Ras-like GTPase activity (Roadblock/LC7/MglB family)
MDAGQALADLTEISSQIEGAVLVEEDGTMLASTFGDDERSRAVAAHAGDLLRTARESRAASGRAELSQVLVVTPAGAVFLVRDEGRAVAAVTGAEPTVGLVFYDLKTCLRLAASEKGGLRGGRKKASGTSGGGTHKRASEGGDGE